MSEDQVEDKLDFQLVQRRASSETEADTDVWPLQLSTIFIDHYVLGDIIGRGSYAEVREAIDSRTLERCAVKIVDRDYLKQRAPNALLNQLQEVNLLRHLDHPNIISMRECLEKGSRLYIIVEFCPFVLQEIMLEQPENRLCAIMSRCIFHQIIKGLHHLHSLRIAHRDIKPQNILITNGGSVKIIDLGVAAVLSMWAEQDLCTNHEGSPLFQSPEVVVGKLEYDGYKADVWSAGVTLYLMLFGSYPFHSETLLTLYDQILGKKLKFPDGSKTLLDPHFVIISDIISWMLEKSHHKRPTTGELLEHPWLSLDCIQQGYEYNEFIDKILEAPHNESAKHHKDVYRSMSALPYLYNLHFPNLPVTKAKRSESKQSSISIDTDSTDTMSEVDPHEVISDSPLEWGNERQYKLMKTPLIRANRLRRGKQRRKRQSKD